MKINSMFQRECFSQSDVIYGRRRPGSQVLRGTAPEPQYFQQGWLAQVCRQISFEYKTNLTTNFLAAPVRN
jgi:hypothetical protein